MATTDEGLVRAIGVRGLTASIVNTTVGAGIFVLPAAVAAGVGNAAPIAYLVCGLAMCLVVTCFAMAGSRVALTGGLYAYVEVAFGPFVGFVIGLLLWVSCVGSAASVGNAFAGTVGLMIPPVAGGAGRVVLLVAGFGLLAAVNVRGLLSGLRLVETLTVLKLLPLAVFVGVGLFFVDPAALAWPGWPAADDLGRTVLLLIFAFVGVELAVIPSGEVKDPARTVPRALFLALAATTLLYLAIQLVAAGVLRSELAQHVDAPLADASARFLGLAGRALILGGTAVSMFGFMSGDMLGVPRTLFAFGRDGFLPRRFAAVHPRWHTPHVSIVSYAAIVCSLAVAGTFEQLVLISNVALLTVYVFCCAAAFELARRDVRIDGIPFRVPGGMFVPPLACAVLIWILVHATRREFAVTGLVVALAAALYGVRSWRFRKT